MLQLRFLIYATIFVLVDYILWLLNLFAINDAFWIENSLPIDLLLILLVALIPRANHLRSLDLIMQGRLRLRITLGVATLVPFLGIFEVLELSVDFLGILDKRDRWYFKLY